MVLLTRTITQQDHFNLLVTKKLSFNRKLVKPGTLTWLLLTVGVFFWNAQRWFTILQ